MFNAPSSEQLARIPGLYETMYIPIAENLVYLHFFIKGCHWYVVEYDGKDTFFGFIIPSNFMKPFIRDYFSFSELQSFRYVVFEIHHELSWTVKPANAVEEIKSRLRSEHFKIKIA